MTDIEFLQKEVDRHFAELEKKFDAQNIQFAEMNKEQKESYLASMNQFIQLIENNMTKMGEYNFTLQALAKQSEKNEEVLKSISDKMLKTSNEDLKEDLKIITGLAYKIETSTKDTTKGLTTLEAKDNKIKWLTTLIGIISAALIILNMILQNFSSDRNEKALERSVKIMMEKNNEKKP